jgi:hypothetical protein
VLEHVAEQHQVEAPLAEPARDGLAVSMSMSNTSCSDFSARARLLVDLDTADDGAGCARSGRSTPPQPTSSTALRPADRRDNARFCSSIR